MKITTNKTSELTASLTIHVEEADYTPIVEKQLKDHKKTATLKGFRPGMVPMGMIRKMYGKAIQLEEINKLISESLSNHIKDEKMKLLGEPLPNETEQTKINFDTQKEFDFIFDIAVAPEINVKIDNEAEYTYHKIAVTDNMIDDQIKYHTQRFGQNVDAEIVSDKSLLKGILSQTNAEGELTEGGMIVEATSLGVYAIKDEEIQKQFIEANKAQILNFDVKKAFPSDAELSAMLKIEKEELETLEPYFQFEIQSISDFVDGTVDQELFDKVFGEGTVANEEEFRAKVQENIGENFVKDSNYKFLVDAKDKILGELSLEMPEEFLKRWLKFTDKENKFTDEIFENEFPDYLNVIKWQLIREKISLDNKLEVNPEELKAAAIESVRMQFIQYGMPADSLPDEQLEKFAEETILNKQEEVNKLFDQKMDEKVSVFVKENVKINEKEVSLDEFSAFFETK